MPNSRFENIALWNGKSWGKTAGKVLSYLRDSNGKTIGYLLELEDGSMAKTKHGGVIFLDRKRGFHPLEGLK